MGSTRKGVTQPQNGFIDGVVNVTTDLTTVTVNVSTVAGYSSVTSILYAAASLNVGAAIASTIASPYPLCMWTTTDATIKVTLAASQSTATIGIRFVAQ